MAKCVWKDCSLNPLWHHTPMISHQTRPSLWKIPRPRDLGIQGATWESLVPWLCPCVVVSQAWDGNSQRSRNPSGYQLEKLIPVTCGLRLFHTWGFPQLSRSFPNFRTQRQWPSLGTHLFSQCQEALTLCHHDAKWQAAMTLFRDMLWGKNMQAIDCF